MGNMFPWAWAIIALVVSFLELHSPGYYLIWIACAAAITAVLTFILSLSINAQLLIFIIAAVGACIAGRFIYRRLLSASDQTPLLNQRDVELIGKTGVASQEFQFGQGKVRLGDTVWLAEGPALRKGAAVVVKAVRGTVVIVDVLSPGEMAGPENKHDHLRL
jgi:membrane protein implicated in regulation of membrane protease activity